LTARIRTWQRLDSVSGAGRDTIFIIIWTLLVGMLEPAVGNCLP